MDGDIDPGLSPRHADGERHASGSPRSDRGPAAVRAEDVEPYVALQYVARLFKIATVVVLVALVGEVIAGIILEGPGALLRLAREVIQGIVLAALLWGAADLAILTIDMGHDIRAARMLLGRLAATGTRRQRGRRLRKTDRRAARRSGL